MQRWEYFVSTIRWTDTGEAIIGHVLGSTLDEALNKLGQDGWELVQVIWTQRELIQAGALWNKDVPVAYFKRPL